MWSFLKKRLEGPLIVTPEIERPRDRRSQVARAALTPACKICVDEERRPRLLDVVWPIRGNFQITTIMPIKRTYLNDQYVCQNPLRKSRASALGANAVRRNFVRVTKPECFPTAKAWNPRTRGQVGVRVLRSNFLPVVYYKKVGVQDTSEPPAS